MSATDINRRVVLAARPKGVPEPEHFRVEEVPVTPPGAGQFLVRLSHWSVDPAMRGWVNDVPNYIPPVEIGAVMRNFGVGEVVASRHPDYAEGEIVTGMLGWQRYALSDGSEIDRKVGETDLPPSLALGLLGLNGITAYLGLTQVGAPQPGETVLVSTAAGRGRLGGGADRAASRLPRGGHRRRAGEDGALPRALRL